MEIKITFSVSGYVTETVELNPGVDPNSLVQRLNSGEVATTIQEDGSVIVVGTGEVLGTVVSGDNRCEYDEFVIDS